MKKNYKLELPVLISCILFLCFALINITVTAQGIPYDTTRIYHAMAKARNGENVTIGVIGGSITAGSLASSTNNRWANLVQDWWEATFPAITVSLVNAGIGGTGSDYGTHRIQNDLLDDSPEFVVVEFAVNDVEGVYAEKMMEGLIRQVLSAEGYPGVMILCLKQQNGTTAQPSHKAVAEHYHVPLISQADSIDNAVAADGHTLADVYVDGLHPNDLGMAYIAEFINNELTRIYDSLPDDEDLKDIETVLPAPLETDVFAHTYIYDNSTLMPDTNSGWTTSGTSWITSVLGAEIGFTVDGDAISLMYSRHNAANRGQVEVWVDAGTPMVLDAYWDQTWGPARVFQLLIEGMGSGEHSIHVRTIDEHSAGSTGNYFQILNICKAGDFVGTAPIANSGGYRKALINTQVALDGSESFDPDGDTVFTYSWTIISQPVGSDADLTDADSVIAGFQPDEAGYYKIGLIVSDGVYSSVLDTLTLKVVLSNAAPIADAGDDKNVATVFYTFLDGTGSSDPDGDMLAYSWRMISQPAGSNVSLYNSNTSAPRFAPLLEGQYAVGLTVSDSIAYSAEDTLILTAIQNYSGLSNIACEYPEFMVFPNPASSTVTIQIPEIQPGEIILSLLSVDGREIAELLRQDHNSDQFETVIDLSKYIDQKGVYFLRFRDGSSVRNKKIIYY